MGKMKQLLIGTALCLLAVDVQAQGVSKTWVADRGDGTYKNPVLYADYSDPDAIRVGDDFWMTSSSFNAVPGLQILHSNDLVNWTLAGAAIDVLLPAAHFSSPQHGNGVWAPSIRFHDGEYYIYWGDPDFGVYMVKARDPRGVWEPAVLVKPGKGLIDATPLWDDDGQCYLVHAYAGSRAGIKSIIAITRLSPDGRQAVGRSVTIYDGHEIDNTIEGPKFYKRGDYYYIFAPAGGVATGWQTVLRSKNIWGPYERKVVMAQGNTSVNGPHQGAWVDTPTGEDWFLHFQDVGAYGRLVHLQPMAWRGDWPVIGVDSDGDGCGEPVLTHRKPDVGRTYPVATPAESDEFSTGSLGLQWQWHANPMDWWYYADAAQGVLNLYSVPQPADYKNLWDIPNLLLQKTPAPVFTATAKLRFIPNPQLVGERVGLVMMGQDYALLSLATTPQGFVLSQNERPNAKGGAAEIVNASVDLSSGEIYLRVRADNGACTFSYSLDGRRFTPLGTPFRAREGQWIGAKVGLFAQRPVSNNDGGRAVIDWFHLEK